MGGRDEDSSERRERRKRPRPPLDRASLSELALAYVARFATSRAKLEQYLSRKLRERGWEGDGQPDPAALAEKLAEQGFVNDAQFAEAKASSLLRRGYGGQRVRAALSVAGIAEEDRGGALRAVEDGRWAAALRFAERRRIGPYALAALDQPAREKALAAMIRAGHAFDLSRRLVQAAPGEFPDPDQ